MCAQILILLKLGDYLVYLSTSYTLASMHSAGFLCLRIISHLHRAAAGGVQCNHNQPESHFIMSFGMIDARAEQLLR